MLRACLAAPCWAALLLARLSRPQDAEGEVHSAALETPADGEIPDASEEDVEQIPLPRVRGVSPEDLGKYACQGDDCTFSCFGDPRDVFPHSAINDDACDCGDGSDEPGTAACAGQGETLFYCYNEGSSPRMLYTSRIGDGICDCCDGSDEDERGEGTACANTCAAEAEERLVLVERLQKGLAKQKEARRDAKNTRQGWRNEIARLKEELPEQQKKLEDAKLAQAAAEAARIPPGVATRLGALEGLIADLQAEMRTQRAEITELRSSVESLSAENIRLRATSGVGEAEERASPESSVVADPAEAMEEISPEDIGASLRLQIEAEVAAAAAAAATAEAMPEAASTCQSLEACQAEVAVDAAAPVTAEVAAAGPQVSEYAKWMERSEEVLGTSGGGVSSSDGASPTADTSSLSEIDAGGDAHVEHKPSEAAAAVPAEPVQDAAMLEVNQTELKSSIEKDTASLAELEGKLKFLSDDKLGYFPLMDKCLESKVMGYNYKICFFDDAKQDSVLLGKWSDWQGKGRALFKGGQSCGDGVDRALVVKFRCAEVERIVEIEETNRCQYEAVVHTPGACGKKSQEEVQKALAGQAGRIRLPKDEL